MYVFVDFVEFAFYTGWIRLFVMKVMKVKIVTGKQYFLFLYAINYNNFGQSFIHSFKG